ncbi:alpha/beta fold hydrolase [Desulfurobacterium thermolithotrophum]|uniref:alpha/beta fold hydrolase n=1 Tax=Desulfurobacterium thermolithotrophum TaxID=64160 RepID=UPI0013D471D5|nr:alpha/beta hydrolase [Desulfurobacterium thermolithotrophum]
MDKVFTLHGWSFDGSIWSISSFESAVHLVLPGHGISPFKSTDILNLSKEVGEFIPFGSTLIGWSLGASVAALTAVFYSQKVKELVLYAPTVSFSVVSQPEIVVKRFLRKLGKDFLGTVYYFRNLCSKERWNIPEFSREKTIELLESFTWFDLTPYIKRITLPVTIIVGEKDSVTGLKGAFEFWKITKKCILKVIPEADHLTVLKYS